MTGSPAAQIEDWAFGITTRSREPKLSSHALRDVWRRVPRVVETAQPKVSVVVCSYNGARTLEECLRSLGRLNYPDYEVVLVDDGSTDSTRGIAARFPQVKYIHQSNQGLSVARNVSAQAASGQIVAYTDSDCVVDEDWLLYLVQAMQDQNVDAIGGPNIPPPSDGWTARCVAVSPGGPSHVMLDDRRAEHVPGCNMAFRRDRLIAAGGFDPRFHVAGDDVDICWRFMDAGLSIGYAPAAMVWHHRRNTVRAYFRQQAGYGRSEAMLHVKHPSRFNKLGCARWNGIIYGEGAVGLPVVEPQVHHGRFGMGLFQMIYRRSEFGLWAYPMLLEWHVLALFVMSLAVIFPWIALAAGVMWAASIAAAARSTWRMALPAGAPWWSRGLVFALHLSQPLVRSYHRHRYRLSGKKLPHVPVDNRMSPQHVRRLSRRCWDMYWISKENRGREELLSALQDEAARIGCEVDFESQWSTWDALVGGDWWHDISIHTATEELGWPRKFTRARCRLRFTTLAWVAMTAVMVWIIAATAARHWWAAVPAASVGAWLLYQMVRSQQQAMQAISRLLWRSGHHAKLDDVLVTDARGRRRHGGRCQRGNRRWQSQKYICST